MSEDRKRPPLPPPYGPAPPGRVPTPRPTPRPQRTPLPLERAHELRPAQWADGTPPSPYEEEDTGVIAMQFQSTMAASGHNPEEIVERLAAKMAEKMAGGGGGSKKSDIQGWLKFALTLIVAVLTGWWVLSEKLGERPTEEKMNAEIVEQVAPVAAQTNQNARELREQRDAIIETRGAIKNISEAIGEMKGDLKELKKKRR